jgi:hypothetical protein
MRVRFPSPAPAAAQFLPRRARPERQRGRTKQRCARLGTRRAAGVVPVRHALRRRVQRCLHAGIGRSRIAVPRHGQVGRSGKEVRLRRWVGLRCHCLLLRQLRTRHSKRRQTVVLVQRRGARRVQRRLELPPLRSDLSGRRDRQTDRTNRADLKRPHLPSPLDPGA